MTDNASKRKTPHNIGINNSFLIKMEITAIKPPTVKLPVSPIKTVAGYVLYQRKPTNDPNNAAIKIVISPTLGIYIILRYSEKIILPEVHAKTPSVNTIMADKPADKPSNPSVKLLEFETAEIINIIIGIIISHIILSPFLKRILDISL